MAKRTRPTLLEARSHLNGRGVKGGLYQNLSLNSVELTSMRRLVVTGTPRSSGPAPGTPSGLPQGRLRFARVIRMY